jgi:hypothetical protein
MVLVNPRPNSKPSPRTRFILVPFGMIPCRTAFRYKNFNLVKTLNPSFARFEGCHPLNEPAFQISAKTVVGLRFHDFSFLKATGKFNRDKKY